jgi:hypothetical protein
MSSTVALSTPSWNLAKLLLNIEISKVFKNLQELKNIVLIDEGTFEKIVPYLIIH